MITFISSSEKRFRQFKFLIFSSFWKHIIINTLLLHNFTYLYEFRRVAHVYYFTVKVTTPNQSLESIYWSKWFTNRNTVNHLSSYSWTRNKKSNDFMIYIYTLWNFSGSRTSEPKKKNRMTWESVLVRVLTRGKNHYHW